MAAISFDDLPDAKESISFDDLPEAKHGITFDDLPDAKATEPDAASLLTKNYSGAKPTSTPEQKPFLSGGELKQIGPSGEVAPTQPTPFPERDTTSHTISQPIAQFPDISPATVKKVLQGALAGSVVGQQPEITDQQLQKATGIARGVQHTAQGLTSPTNLALMVGMGGAPSLLQKGAALYFAGQMAKEVPQQISDANNETDPAKKAQGYTEAALNGLMAALAFGHANGRIREIPNLAPGASEKQINDAIRLAPEPPKNAEIHDDILDGLVAAKDAAAKAVEANPQNETLRRLNAAVARQISDVPEDRVNAARERNKQPQQPTPPAEPAGGTETAVESGSPRSQPATETTSTQGYKPRILEAASEQEVGQPVPDEVKAQVAQNLADNNAPLTAAQVSNELETNPNRTAPAAEDRNVAGGIPEGTNLDTSSERGSPAGTTGESGLHERESAAQPASAREAGQPIAFDPQSVSAYASKLPESTKNVVLNVLNKGMSVEDAASAAGTTVGKAQEIIDKAHRFIPQAKTIEPLSARSYEDQPSREARPDASEVEALKDWTSATQEGRTEATKMKRGGGEVGAISIPKFADRKMSPLDEATTLRSAKLQKSFDEATRAQKEINKQVPSVKRQNAVSVWMEAGGDIAKLAQWEAAAKGKMFREAARDAQNLTPEEIAIAQRAKSAFDILAQRGLKFDVLKNGRDNYVPHVWDIEKKGSVQGSGKLQQNFRFAKARTFENFFEGDQAGFEPKTLAIGRLLPSYLHEMNRVIADRQMVQDLATRDASDGRPLVVPRGRVYEITKEDQGKAFLANPRAVKGLKDEGGNPIDTSDYRALENQPALHEWRWEAKDENGNPIFMKDDLAVHPETAKRLNSILGKSAIKEWYSEPSTGAAQIPKAIIKALDVSQNVMKREMFSLLAPFHQVQEGWHGIAHRVNPFFDIPKIDLRDTGQIDAAKHGLMLLPDRTLATNYMEGVGSQGSFITKFARSLSETFSETVGEKSFEARALNTLANIVDGYQSYLFHQYIPGLKYKTYEAMRSRNMQVYYKELKSGQLTDSDVKLLSAEQTNAAYGHLNLALLDRNPTMQHLMQIGLLAPDFLEARGRFTGQAFKGLLGSKVGAEQFKAIATIAAVQVSAAYILTKLGGDEWDPKHPFEVVHGGRRYTLRSIPEDIASFISDPRQFIYGRVNPLIVKGGIQFATGLNYRGEKTTALQTAEELLAQYIPITARAIPGIRSLTETGRQSPLTPLEQLAGSLGVRVSRKSPISDTYKLASDWMDKQGIPKDKGSYPVSKYQQLRYALEDGDFDRAGKAYDELLKAEKPEKIVLGFRSSVLHPFTKSAATDAQFSKSLKPSEKAVYDLATQKRGDILKKFSYLRSQAQASPKK